MRVQQFVVFLIFESCFLFIKIGLIATFVPNIFIKFNQEIGNVKRLRNRVKALNSKSKTEKQQVTFFQVAFVRFIFVIRAESCQSTL